MRYIYKEAICNMINLKKLRLDRNLSQNDVAIELKISQNHYSNIEIGHRKPSVTVAKKIAKFFGFEQEWYKLLDTSKG